MRIDRLRNQIAATRSLLDVAEQNIDDLHVLAYDRRQAQAERVNGGERDWCLDTHGDPRARQLLRDGATTLDGSLAEVAAWCHGVRAFFTDGELAGRRKPFTVTSSEQVEALEAQQRRRRRGEYSPTRVYPQNVDQVIAENRQLRKRIEDLERERTP